MSKISLLAIVGPTASGKTAAAIEIAQSCNGEIVCADSRTIYREMNIVTAKPTPEEQAAVPHHLLDVVDPGERFTVADFQRLANRAITDIQQRGKLPILVGGTGLYIDAVLYNYSFRSDLDAAQREHLAKLPLGELQQRADDLALQLNDSDYRNRRRLVRAIETVGQPSGKQPLRSGAAIIGIAPDISLLEVRIRSRIQKMLSDGLLEEVRRIGDRYGWDNDATFGIGYRAFAAVARGEGAIDVATEASVRGDIQLSKRQLTWFKRNLDIQWCNSSEDAVKQALILLRNNV